MKRGIILLFFCSIMVYAGQTMAQDDSEVSFENRAGVIIQYRFPFQVGPDCKCRNYEEYKKGDPDIVKQSLDLYQVRSIEICKADIYIMIGGDSGIAEINREMLKIFRNTTGKTKLHLVDRKKREIMAKRK